MISLLTTRSKRRRCDTGRGGEPIDQDGGDDRGERSVRALDFSLQGEELLRAGLSLFLQIKSAIGLLLSPSRAEVPCGLGGSGGR